VLGPLNSLVWYVPSLRYTRGLGWRMHCGAEVTESSTNKQHHLSQKEGRKEGKKRERKKGREERKGHRGHCMPIDKKGWTRRNTRVSEFCCVLPSLHCSWDRGLPQA
jgi:hypothetical protein